MRVRAVRQETAEETTLRATVRPGETTSVNLIFSGTATVVGTVIYPNVQPAAGVAVVGGTVLTRTDANGNFTIARIGVGHQRLRAANEMTGTEATIEVDIGAPNIVVPVTIVLPGSGMIRGVLRDARGHFKAGVDVFLWFGTSGFLRATPDGSGAFVFRSLPLRSDYTLRASDADGDGQIQPVALIANGPHIVQDVGFRGLGTVTGVGLV